MSKTINNRKANKNVIKAMVKRKQERMNKKVYWITCIDFIIALICSYALVHNLKKDELKWTLLN